MTTSPPIKKVSMLSLSKGLFIVMHKVGGIVKVLDVVSSISLWAVSSPINEILYYTAFTFFYYPLVK